MDVILHTGAEHPDMAWILVIAVLSFIAGTGFGAYLYSQNRAAEPWPGASTNES